MKKVKKYIAILNQFGTATPTATVMQNDFDDDIVWARTGVGTYTGTMTGIMNSENELKTTMDLSQTSAPAVAYLYRDSDDVIFIETVNSSTLVATDSKLYNARIEICRYDI